MRPYVTVVHYNSYISYIAARNKYIFSCLQPGNIQEIITRAVRYFLVLKLASIALIRSEEA